MKATQKVVSSNYLKIEKKLKKREVKLEVVKTIVTNNKVIIKAKDTKTTCLKQEHQDIISKALYIVQVDRD